MRNSQNQGKLSWICDAAFMGGLILFLLSIYPYKNGSVDARWVVLPGALVIAAYSAGIVASCFQILQSERARSQTFRIDRTLIEKLKAKQFPSDVIEALQQLIRVDEIIPENKSRRLEEVIVSETVFVSLLEAKLKKERTNEVKKMLLNYAKVREEENRITETSKELASGNGAMHSGGDVKPTPNTVTLVQAASAADN